MPSVLGSAGAEPHQGHMHRRESLHAQRDTVVSVACLLAIAMLDCERDIVY